MMWRVRGALGLGLLALGFVSAATSVGCGGGGASLTDRLSRLAGTYNGTGTLNGIDASLSVTVSADGSATGTLSTGGSSGALTGFVTSAGVLTMAGPDASLQGSLSETGGTLSVLRGQNRASIAVTRPATPTPTVGPTATPSPTPSPAPTPTPQPGLSNLSAALFPLHEGDVWRFSVSGGRETNVSEAIGAEALRDGRNVFPRERRDPQGRATRRDYLLSGLTGGFGIVEQEDVLATDGSTNARTTLGQSLLVSYALTRGQAGTPNALGGTRSSEGYLGSVSVAFTASFLRGERVTVGAGTFDCAVIRTVQQTSYTQGGALQTETSDVTEWRAEGVGLVKRTEGGVAWTLDSATVDGRSYP